MPELIKAKSQDLEPGNLVFHIALEEGKPQGIAIQDDMMDITPLSPLCAHMMHRGSQEQRGMIPPCSRDIGIGFKPGFSCGCGFIPHP